MHSRWYNFAVVVLWLTTMSWLVIVKIMPTLAVGDPPDRFAILSAQAEEQLVGYEVSLDDSPVGWALVRGERLTSGGTFIDGRIRFDRLPVRQMVPEALVKLFGLEESLPADIQLDAQNQVYFHANGRLQRFDSAVSLDPAVSMVRVEGFVAGDTMVVTIRAAGKTYEMHRPLPRDVMVSDAMMPQSRMPGLWEGRKWTVEVYSPLRPRMDPLEIMQAEVVAREPITWSGRVENAWLVVYRGDPGSDAGRAGKERAWLWVRDDGIVLRHRIALFDSMLTFVRVPDGNQQELEAFFQKPLLPRYDLGEPVQVPRAVEAAPAQTEAEAGQP